MSEALVPDPFARERFLSWMADWYLANTDERSRIRALHEADGQLRVFVAVKQIEFGDVRVDWSPAGAAALAGGDLWDAL